MSHTMVLKDMPRPRKFFEITYKLSDYLVVWQSLKLWNVDIIIEDIKFAVLWNGPWHYKQITKSHSVKQTQNRDKIKIKEIKESGWTPYIIKDMGKANKDFVKEKFDEFLKYLKENTII